MMPAPVRSSFEAGGRALPTPVELCHEPVRPQARGAGRRRPGTRKLDGPPFYASASCSPLFCAAPAGRHPTPKLDPLRPTLPCLSLSRSALLCGSGRPASGARRTPRLDPPAANSAVPQPLAVSSSVRRRPVGIRGAPDAEVRPSCGQLFRASASCGQLISGCPSMQPCRSRPWPACRRTDSQDRMDHRAGTP
jgi:hypothetical protein